MKEQLVFMVPLLKGHFFGQDTTYAETRGTLPTFPEATAGSIMGISSRSRFFADPTEET